MSNIICVKGRSYRNVGTSNMHLVHSQGEACLIDTAMGLDDASRIVEQMGSLDLEPDALNLVINTHFHMDHLFGNTAIKGACDPSFASHVSEKSAIENWDEYMQMCGVVGSEMEPVFNHVRTYLKYEPVEVDIPLEDGDEITVGDVELKVIHTPGHSPGHICLYEEETRTLVSGDLVFSVPAPWYGHGHPVSSVDEHLTSLERILELDVDVILPGHGSQIENPRECVQNTIDEIYSREAQLKSLLSDGKDRNEEESINAVFGIKSEQPVMFKRNMIEHHLRRIERDTE